MQEYEEQQKRLKANQRNDYKNTLETQIKMTEDAKFRNNAEMLEHEKKMHEQFNVIYPVINLVLITS